MKKILIIEDDPILGKMYQQKFYHRGYEVTLEPKGEEGFATAEKLQPDFILLDLMLPKVDGVTILKSLKENQNTQHIPVAVLTVIPLGLTIGFDKKLMSQVVAYWRKDEIKPSQLVADVDEYLKKKGEK